MTYGGRLGICAAASIAGHLMLARGTAHLPPRVEAAPPAIVHVALRETAPEPEPEPEKAREAKPELPRQAPARRARSAVESARANPTKNVTPTERPDDSKSASDTPVFGISMESTSTAGGPGFHVGNTLQTRPKEDGAVEAGDGQRLAAPVPAYEVTKMPVPKGGQCAPGPYTNEAREAGIEGTVILTFVVDEKGRVRDIKVLQGLGMGLTEVAKRALAACPFEPGERNGQRVPTRVPAYKVRFTLRENE